MGDLFVAWIAIDRFLTDLQREVLARFEAIRARGGSIRFVVGNRDYLPERMLGRAFDAVHGEETLIDLCGAPTMIVHGDRLNPRDRPYLAWYRFSRSRPLEALIERLPAFVGRRIARSEEHTSELQSPCNLVCRLLLEKKKNQFYNPPFLSFSSTFSFPSTPHAPPRPYPLSLHDALPISICAERRR